jgi:uncharacterized protein YbbC (DUF1343 family)
MDVIKNLQWLILLLGVPLQGQQLVLGVDAIPPSLLSWLKTHSIGLITNHTGKNEQGYFTRDILRKQGVTVQALFVPEHGLSGKVPAGEEVHHDTTQTIPVYSLYDVTRGDSIPPEVFKNIDAFIFDIQDSGMRHYTYSASLWKTLKVAAQMGKRFIVLDRPNPLLDIVDGPLPDEHVLQNSFISSVPVPVRHGLTLGELARYLVNYYLSAYKGLYVVPMKHYTPTTQCPASLITTLSPNIHTIDACYGYSFLGLLGEVRPFDLGIGTPQAFTCITFAEDAKCPSHFWPEITELLARYAITSKPYAYYNERKKQRCCGITITVTDIAKVRSFELLVAILKLAKKMNIPLHFSPSFDKAIGTHKVRDYLQGNMTQQELECAVQPSLLAFKQRAESIRLYRH